MLLQTFLNITLKANACRTSFFGVSKLHTFSLKNLDTCKKFDVNKLLGTQLISQNFVFRSKHKNERKPSNIDVEEESDESEDEEEELQDFVPAKGTKLLKVLVSSMRVDNVLRIGVGVTKEAIEEAFYQSRIYKNGSKVLKKGAQVYLGDELDLVNEEKPENPKFIYVTRIKIISGKLDDSINQYRVTLLREKNLLLESYEKPIQEEEGQE